MNEYVLKYPESINIKESSLRELVGSLGVIFNITSYVIESLDEKISFDDLEKVFGYLEKEKTNIFFFKIMLKGINNKERETDNLILAFRNRIEGITDYKISFEAKGMSESGENVKSIKQICNMFVAKNTVKLWQITKAPLIFISFLILLVVDVVRFWNNLGGSYAVFFGTVIASVGSSLSIFSMSKPAKKVKNYIFPKVRFNIGRCVEKERKAFILRILSVLLLIGLITFLILVK